MHDTQWVPRSPNSQLERPDRVLTGGRISHLRGTWVRVEDERGIDISCSDELQRLKIATQF